MMPGGRGMNPKMLQQMMKQLGIQVEEIDGVERVVIETPTKTYTFTKPSVSAMKAQGQTTYQVQGEPAITPKGGATAPGDPAAAQPKALYSEEDVKMVMQAAGVSKDKAKQALEEADGEVATAIVALSR
ncbi:MAG: nascent polypeptide-associated complex protein [Halobacteriales archaeon]|nr:nascent polypeptide-associated complex protein [Halobacteriales archaeon]